MLASGLMLGGAVAAMFLRNLVHCVLALGIALVSLAALFLQLGAQFAGLAQILVYVGAVSILILFAVLLTRGGVSDDDQPERSGQGWLGVAIALGMFLVLAGVLFSSRLPGASQSVPPTATVRQIGDQLMTTWVVPLEVVGLLLTAALIGAVVLAMRPGPGEAQPEVAAKSPGAQGPTPQAPKA